MTVAQSAKETEAEGLRTAQPEGEASNMRASEDILERAKTSLKRHDPINQGFYTSMPPEDVQIWKELIAEVEAKNDKIAQDVITIQMHHENILTLQKEVERLRTRETEFAEMSNTLSEKLKQFVLGSAEHSSNVFEIAEQLIDEHESKDAYIKRLEAAFLEQFAEGITAPKEKAELMAREALALIKEEKG